MRVAGGGQTAPAPGWLHAWSARPLRPCICVHAATSLQAMVAKQHSVPNPHHKPLNSPAACLHHTARRHGMHGHWHCGQSGSHAGSKLADACDQPAGDATVLKADVQLAAHAAAE